MQREAGLSIVGSPAFSFSEIRYAINMRKSLLAALAGVVFLCGCGPNDNDPGPGGVTVGEARALDEAAEMIEQQGAAARSAADTVDSLDTSLSQ